MVTRDEVEITEEYDFNLHLSFLQEVGPVRHSSVGGPIGSADISERSSNCNAGCRRAPGRVHSCLLGDRSKYDDT